MLDRDQQQSNLFELGVIFLSKNVSILVMFVVIMNIADIMDECGGVIGHMDVKWFFLLAHMLVWVEHLNGHCTFNVVFE